MALRRKWFVPLSVACVVGVAAVLLGTTGRFLARPSPTTGTVGRQFSHPVPVEKIIPFGTGEDVKAAGGDVIPIVPQGPSHFTPSTSGAFQKVQVTVSAVVKPSPLREDAGR